MQRIILNLYGFLFRNGCDQCPQKCYAGPWRNGDPSGFQCAGDDRKSSDRGDSGATSRIYRRDRSRTDSLGHYGDPAVVKILKMPELKKTV